MMFHGGTRKEDYPLGAAWANNHFICMVTSPPVTRGVHPVRSEPVTGFQNWNRFQDLGPWSWDRQMGGTPPGLSK